eukprot:scaffold163_cov162-Skeletonema_dohrnii-CCMP3373.AAC.1
MTIEQHHKQPICLLLNTGIQRAWHRAVTVYNQRTNVLQLLQYSKHILHNTISQIAPRAAHLNSQAAAGRITSDVWDGMTRTQRKAWMQLGRAMREQLLPEGTVLRPPPPRNGQNVVIPGNGVTARIAYSADMSEMSIINAMKANTLTGTTPSGGLHSSRRQMQLIPLPKNTAANLAMNRNDRRVNMVIASPSQAIGNRFVSTAMHSAPVFITRRNVSNVLSSARFPDISTSTDDDAIPWSVNMAVMNPRPSVWSLSNGDLAFILGLIDGGANVGLANPNCLRLLQYALPSRKINVTGIGNSRLEELRIGTFAGTAKTTCGSQVILIFHEYGEMEKAVMVDRVCIPRCN